MIEAAASADMPAWQIQLMAEQIAPRLRLTPEETVKLTMKVVSLNPGSAVASISLKRLVEIAPRLDVETSREVAALLARGNFGYDPNDLAQAFERLAPRLDRAGATAAARSVLPLVAQNAEHRTAVIRAFDVLARRLGANDLASLALLPLDAAAVGQLERRLGAGGAATAVGLLVRKSATTTNEHSLAALVYVASRLLPKLDAKQARAAAGAMAGRSLKLGAATKDRVAVAALARAYSQLAPWLDGKEARGGAAALAQAVLSAAASGTNAANREDAAFSALAESFELLLPLLSAAEAVKLAQAALQRTPKATDPRSLDVLARAFARLAPRLDAKEARAGAAVLGRAALAWKAAAVLGRVAALLGPEEAAEVAQALRERLAVAADASSFAWLAQGLAHLAPRLDAKQAHGVAAALAQAINRLPDGALSDADLGPSARAFGRLAPQLDPAEANTAVAALSRRLYWFEVANIGTVIVSGPDWTVEDIGHFTPSGEGNDEKKENENLAAVATAFELFAPQLTAKTAGQAARAALGRLTQVLHSSYAAPLQRGLKALEARLDPEERAATARAALQLLDEAEYEYGADALARVFERLDRREAAAKMQAALAVVAKHKHSATLCAMAGTLHRLAPHLTSRQVRDGASTIMRAALARIAKHKRPAELFAAAGTLHRLAPHLTPQEVREAALAIERQFLDLSSSRVSITLQWLPQVYERIVSHLDAEQAATVARALVLARLAMKTINPETGQPFNPLDDSATEGTEDDGGGELPKEFKALFGRLTDQVLIDVLKSAASVDLYRDTVLAVLAELGRRTKREFADLWDFVAWAQDNRPDLDLLTPPQPLEG